MIRKKIVAGNWKMNLDYEQAMSLASEVVHKIKDEVFTANVSVIAAPPFPYLYSVSKLFAGEPHMALAAQNCSDKESGAYTGEVSAAMLKSVGVKYVIVGHSERRDHFGEDTQVLTSKVKRILEQNLTPIFCCGEPLAIRKAEEHFMYVGKQIRESLFNFSKSDIEKIILAYEPVWAIGTGLTATAEQAQEMHANIRRMFTEQYGYETASKTSILYGGSCNASNAAELFACPDVDGGLIGGASLKSGEFAEIVKTAAKFGSNIV